ncbi:MBL fold metallo-hydrolase [Afipia carboxidovorans]|uniref:MBL fold metallo-hydrolase n=1 Tax=Afipia carboxidovorans TaxID=40137 RepID=UPI003088F8D8|nr:MBL fold metallo-hydrolase [Afipia carboxidovorans]
MALDNDIPFNRNFPLKSGVVDRPVPGVRRVLCDNPGPFTFTGTVSYIVGEGRVAIVDPGPDDDAHIAALLDAVRGETVTHIFVTHTHRDHSPAVPKIRQATGATVYAEGPHRAARPMHEGEPPRNKESNDLDFRPDVALTDGEVVSGEGWSLQAVSTPGHTANHMAFAWRERSLIFVGDHVMGWSTTIVVPPDGAMIHFMASLEKLAARPERLYFPGHGPEIEDGPRFADFMIRHRRAREASILHRLAKGDADIPSIVRASYIGIDPRLVSAAGYSVLAHLEDLAERGIVVTDGAPTIAKTYRLLVPLG